jgi:hypothetical protein
MSPTTILARIRALFDSDASEHLDGIRDALLRGTLREPARPMSDQELARAIREFRALPVSEWTVARLSRRFLDAAAHRND